MAFIEIVMNDLNGYCLPLTDQCIRYIIEVPCDGYRSPEILSGNFKVEN